MCHVGILKLYGFCMACALTPVLVEKSRGQCCDFQLEVSIPSQPNPATAVFGNQVLLAKPVATFAFPQQSWAVTQTWVACRASICVWFCGKYQPSPLDSSGNTDEKGIHSFLWEGYLAGCTVLTLHFIHWEFSEKLFCGCLTWMLFLQTGASLSLTSLFVGLFTWKQEHWLYLWLHRCITELTLGVIVPVTFHVQVQGDSC
jgi:hypothetical protein